MIDNVDVVCNGMASLQLNKRTKVASILVIMGRCKRSRQNSQTALHIVSKHKNSGRLLLLLLDEGAQLNVIDKHGYTLLDSNNGNNEVVKILLSYGADIFVETEKNYQKKNAMDFASDGKKERTSSFCLTMYIILETSFQFKLLLDCLSYL